MGGRRKREDSGSMNLTRFALKPSDIEKGMEEPEPKEEYSEEPKFVQYFL